MLTKDYKKSVMTREIRLFLAAAERTHVVFNLYEGELKDLGWKARHDLRLARDMAKRLNERLSEGEKV